MQPFRPMLATVADRGADGDAWCTSKWDRMLGTRRVRDGVVTVWSRNERDVAGRRPELEELAARLRRHAARRRGRGPRRRAPELPRAHQRMHVSDRRRAQRLGRHPAGVTLMVFDLLRLSSAPTSRPSRGRARCTAGAARPHRPALAGARGLRGRPPSCATPPGSRGRGHRQQAQVPPLCHRTRVARRHAAHRTSLSVISGAGVARCTDGRLGAVLVGLPDGDGGWRLSAAWARAWPAPRARRSPCACAPSPGRASRRRGACDRRQRHDVGRAADSSSTCAPRTAPRPAPPGRPPLRGALGAWLPTTWRRSTMPEYVRGDPRCGGGRAPAQAHQPRQAAVPSTETTKGEVLLALLRAGCRRAPAHIEHRPVTRVRWPHGVGDQSFFEKNLPSGAPSWLPRSGWTTSPTPLWETSRR